MDLMKTNTYEETEVITTDLIAQEHSVTKSDINKMYNRNKQWFEEGKDVFIILRSKENLVLYRNLFGSNAQKEAYLFTESGYIRLFNIMKNNADSIKACNRILKIYFKSKNPPLYTNLKRTQEELFDIIKASLTDDLILQTEVTTKSGYRVDGLIKELNIILECDENNHDNYNKNKESDRETIIMNDLDAVDIYRFNPDDPNFNIGNVISYIYKERDKQNDIRHMFEEIKKWTFEKHT